VGGLFGFALIIAAIFGFLHGLTDDRPSFWRGFGQGLAGRGKSGGKTYLFFHDPRTGLGMGTQIEED
jgi:hypothetical protein